MQRDIQLYQEYAQILIDNAPCEFKKITSDCILSAKNAFSSSERTVENLTGELRTFGAKAKDTYREFKLLIELRDFMISQGQPPWTGMVFTLHSDGKFTTEFSYDPLEDDQ